VVPPLESILERVGHAEEFHGDEFFVGLFVQHIEISPDFMSSLMIEIGLRIFVGGLSLSFWGCAAFMIGGAQW
jgi:hypothetical protein